jgi:hypothetical protein
MRVECRIVTFMIILFGSKPPEIPQAVPFEGVGHFNVFGHGQGLQLPMGDALRNEMIIIIKYHCSASQMIVRSG